MLPPRSPTSCGSLPPQGGRALGQGSQSLRDTLGAARRAAFVKSVL